MKGNEQIELKAQRYLYERAHLSGSCVVTTFDPFDLEQAFIDGAEWQKKQLIDKACEWLESNVEKYIYNVTPYPDADFKARVGGKCWEYFRKAMEI